MYQVTELVLPYQKDSPGCTNQPAIEEWLLMLRLQISMVWCVNQIALDEWWLKLWFTFGFLYRYQKNECCEHPGVHVVFLTTNINECWTYGLLHVFWAHTHTCTHWYIIYTTLQSVVEKIIWSTRYPTVDKRELNIWFIILLLNTHCHIVYKLWLERCRPLEHTLSYCQQTKIEHRKEVEERAGFKHRTGWLSKERGWTLNGGWTKRNISKKKNTRHY
jgi:hypothetical protein